MTSIRDFLLISLVGSVLFSGMKADSDGNFEEVPIPAEVEDAPGNGDTDDGPIGLYDPELFQGDIMIDQDPLAFSADNGQMSAVMDANLLWPNNIVPYEISSNYTPSQQQIIENAMRDFETRTGGCIRFRRRTSHDEHSIFIENDLRGRCSSLVGRRTARNRREQIVRLGASGRCVVQKIIQHELMHVIGFYHEQARSDRDEYIEIVEENIQRGMEEQFSKQEHSDSFGLPYDFQSVMHYPRKIFAKSPNLDTIRPRASFEGVTFGNNYGLSPNDVTKVKMLYQCSGHHQPRTSTTTQSTREPFRPVYTDRRPVRPRTTTPDPFDLISSLPDDFLSSNNGFTQQCKKTTQCVNGNCQTRYMGNCENMNGYSSSGLSSDSGLTQQCKKTTRCVNGDCQTTYKGNCENMDGYSSSGLSSGMPLNTWTSGRSSSSSWPQTARVVRYGYSYD